MTRRGFSPLERRLLLALLSLMTETETDPDFWPDTDLPLRRLYDRCYRLDPEKSHELQRRNQRQSMRRALGRLHPEYVYAFALGWVNTEDWMLLRWQGGGTRRDGCDTPRWRLVGLTESGIAVAQLLAQEGDAS